MAQLNNRRYWTKKKKAQSIIKKLEIIDREIKKIRSKALLQTSSNFYFSPNDSLSKTMKNVFISSKKDFSFLRYLNFVIMSFHLFISVGHCLRGWWSNINLKVYDIINCLNENLITHFVWYLGKEKKVWQWNIETLTLNTLSIK